jgi:hypothetical protein
METRELNTRECSIPTGRHSEFVFIQGTSHKHDGGAWLHAVTYFSLCPLLRMINKKYVTRTCNTECLLVRPLPSIPKKRTTFKLMLECNSVQHTLFADKMFFFLYNYMFRTSSFMLCTTQQISFTLQKNFHTTQNIDVILICLIK